MSERFTDAFLDELRQRVPISEVVGQFVSWDKSKSRDGDKWACCPFHGEDTPSFHAEDAKGIYHCFGCGATGNSFQFLTENQGMGFADAVAFVAELAGMAMPAGYEATRWPNLSRQAKPQEREGAPPAASDDAKRVPIKGYDYHDADGNVLYQVVRYQFRLPDGSWRIDPKTGNPEKTFRQRRKDAGGEIVYNLDGVGHTIYRHNHVEIAISEGQTIFMPEGEKDADTLVEWGLCATTNSGGSANWRPELAKLFAGADVVILSDNDEPGRKVADAKARSLKGIAARVRVLDFAKVIPDFPAKGDVTDWRDRFGGTREKLIEIVDALPDWRPSPPASKFGAYGLSEARARVADHEWLVHDMIELGGTAAFSGFSQSGKSFLMIELAFAVATGSKFFGRDVKQGLVLYQVGEGEKGFNKRIEGYLQDRGITDLSSIPIKILPKKINLFHSDDDTKALIDEGNAWADYYGLPLRLFVIDTYNKATRGANEISGHDIGLVNERVERIAKECGCTAMVVDHLNKNGGSRGHGSKVDDFTNAIKVVRDDKKTDRNSRPIRRMHLDKNKEGENGGTIPFVLRQVVLGYDELARPVTTCVVDPPDGDDFELEKGGRLSLNQSMVLRTLREVIDAEGQEPPQDLAATTGRRHVVAYSKFMAGMRRKWQFRAPESEPEKRTEEVNRVVADAGKRLQLAGFIDRDNERKLIWWTGKDDRPQYKPVVAPKTSIPADVMDELKDMESPF